MKVSNSDSSFVVVPSATPAAVIVIVGEVVSCVQVKCIDSMLAVEEPSVYLDASTYMLQRPSTDGVNVAVYVVPEPANELIAPVDTVMSPSTKSSVDTDEINVIVKVASFVVAPVATTLVPSVAVIVIIGFVLLYVHTNGFAAVLLFPALSVNPSAST